jgi:hypothetical protein
MSYILDALKKSEKERTRKRTPNLANLQHVGSSEAIISIKGIISLVFAIAIVNGLVIYLFFSESRKQSLTLNTGVVAEPANPVASDHLIGNRMIKKESSKGNNYHKVPTSEPKEIAQGLPPALEVTAHIYASESDLRMVKINGINRHEGDYLAKSHQLVEITEKGIILKYYGELYNLNVVDQWQLN